MFTQFEKPCCSKSAAQTKVDHPQCVDQLQLYLKPLDDLLRCHICFEYFNTCMVTKCNHNYCSLCIRKYMTYKTQCPECFQEATEPELRNNRLIDEILCTYQQIKNNFSSFLQSASAYFDHSSSDSTTLPFNAPAEAVARELSMEEKRYEFELLRCVNNGKTFHQPCSDLVLSGEASAHLNICLSGSSPKRDTVMKEQKRQPLPKVVYHLLSDKEIRKRLKDNGLSTTGNRQALIRRHKSFLLLHNSDCDSLHPRPVADIIKQVEKEEIDFSAEESSKLFQSNKKSSPTMIEQEHEQYVELHAHEFNSLISEIEKRQLKQKCPDANFKKSVPVDCQKTEVVDLSDESREAEAEQEISNTEALLPSTSSVQNHQSIKIWDGFQLNQRERKSGRKENHLQKNKNVEN